MPFSMLTHKFWLSTQVACYKPRSKLSLSTRPWHTTYLQRLNLLLKPCMRPSANGIQAQYPHKRRIACKKSSKVSSTRSLRAARLPHWHFCVSGVPKALVLLYLLPRMSLRKTPSMQAPRIVHSHCYDVLRPLRSMYMNMNVVIADKLNHVAAYSACWFRSSIRGGRPTGVP